VVEFYGDQIMGHPVGTGPFRLVAWQRSSKIVLERNPDFREELYDARPASDDKIGQAIFAKMKGRKLPMIDRVELAIIEESQPRWLAFLNGEQDTVNIPLEFINVGAPNGKVAPALAKRGIELDRTISPDVAATLFNMEHPSIGGYSPDRVALRRAINLGYNTEEEIRLIRRGAMMLAQSHVPPLTQGYDPNFVSEMSEFSRVRATALLDTYGYVDRDGDGWRETPEGKPLVLDIATQSSQLDRAFNEMWKRQMDRLGIRVNFSVNQWPQNMKNARAGNLMVWTLGWTAGGSDPDAFLALASSHSIGASNIARFKLAEYDQLYQRQQQMSDGPERNEIIHQMKRLFVTYMPYKIHGHRFSNDMTHRRLLGYRRHPFARDFFKWIDVEA
jgi:ABC-type transport system substrate-binding protein